MTIMLTRLLKFSDGCLIAPPVPAHADRSAALAIISGMRAVKLAGVRYAVVRYSVISFTFQGLGWFLSDAQGYQYQRYSTSVLCAVLESDMDWKCWKGLKLVYVIWGNFASVFRNRPRGLKLVLTLLRN